MLLSLLALLYITLVCRGWGLLMRRLFRWQQLQVNEAAREPLLCITGLAAIISLTSILSFIVPAGNALLHILLALPGVLAFLSDVVKNNRKLNLSGARGSLCNNWLTFTAIAYLLLLLQHHAHPVVHPDTLGYHAQLIQWAEKYTPVPGIANLDPRFGLQSNWFTGCAFFAFDFLQLNALSFLNIAVMAWFTWFVLAHIRSCWPGSSSPAAGFYSWVLLFVLSTFSYTQVRLTVSSASPDFIAAVLILTIAYLACPVNRSVLPHRMPLLVLLGLFAATVKLSALPVLIFPFVWSVFNWRYAFPKLVVVSLMLSVLVLVPFLTRNIIASGYPLYPAPVLVWQKADWAVPKEKVQYTQDYVKAYARLKSSEAPETVERIAYAPLNQWVPGWWRQQTTADKVLLAGWLLVILGFIFMIPVRRLWGEQPESILLLLSLTGGLACWFWLAPDPRFGYGYLMATGGICLWKIGGQPAMKRQLTGTGLRRLSIIAVAIMVLSLTVYRFARFFEPSQLVSPTGISGEKKYIEIKDIHVPQATPCECANIPLPCSCAGSDLPAYRGSSIREGFRPAR